MKFIKLEVLSKVVGPSNLDEDDQAYKNVLEELNISSDSVEEDTTEFRPVWLNVKVLNDELLSICTRYDYPDNSVIEYFDSRTMIVNMSPDKLAELLNDTN